MEVKHTPGPWIIKGTNKNLVYSKKGLIAEVWGGTKGGVSKATEANARLIAAAPDLLAALEEIWDCRFSGNAGDMGVPDKGYWANLTPQRCERIRDALSKAKGVA